MDFAATYMCQGILIEILARLPVKSLIRFMAVCRLWKSIITSPQFRLVSNRPTKLLVHIRQGCYTLLEDDHEENRRLIFETDVLLKHYSYDRLEVIGSDNGLLCITITNPYHVIMWNPSIRKHVVVIVPDNHNLSYPIGSGFGGTTSGGDYKYVRIVKLHDGEGGLKKAVDIYSLKEGTWRRKYFDSDFTQDIRGMFPSGALLRGRLHWICGQGIVPFELEDEVFEDNIMVPESIQSPGIYLKVTVIRESLAVLINQIGIGRHSSTFCVLLMEEYGDVNSWIKLFNFVLEGPWSVERNMFHLLKDDELLLGLSGSLCPHKVKLVTFNSKTMKTRAIDGGLLTSSYEEGGFTNYYKESLVLLGDHRAVQNEPCFPNGDAFHWYQFSQDHHAASLRTYLQKFLF